MEVEIYKYDPPQGDVISFTYTGDRVDGFKLFSRTLRGVITSAETAGGTSAGRASTREVRKIMFGTRYFGTSVSREASLPRSISRNGFSRFFSGEKLREHSFATSAFPSYMAELISLAR